VSNEPMSRHTDKPMARAQAHLVAGRYAEAIGAFRAVLGIDPSVISARLGMADAMAARGQQGIAADGLIEAAGRCVEHEQHAQALALYGKALALAPARMELHLDVAVVEQAMGRTDAAVARVEGLAERYMSQGRTDEAAELLRFAESWDEDIEEAEAEEIIEEIEVEEATVIALNPLLSPRPTRPVRRVEVDEAERTVARAVSVPIVFDDMVTRVTSSAIKPAVRTVGGSPLAKPVVASQRPASPPAARAVAPSQRPAVSSSPVRPIAPTQRPAVSSSAARPVAPSQRPAVSAASARPIAPTHKPAVSSSPARPVAPSQRPTASSSPARPVAPSQRLAASSSPAKPVAPSQRPAIPSAKPTAAASVPSSSGSMVVERLRQRAGMGPEVAAVPRSPQGQGSEPLMIRRPSLGRTERERDEEVTLRFRHPRGSLQSAAS
jgi:hypothetical protein